MDKAENMAAVVSCGDSAFVRLITTPDTTAIGVRISAAMVIIFINTANIRNDAENARIKPSFSVPLFGMGCLMLFLWYRCYDAKKEGVGFISVNWFSVCGHAPGCGAVVMGTSQTC